MKQLSKEEFFDMLKEQSDEEGSQAALAKKLGVTPAHLSQMLSGKRGISDRVLRATNYREVRNYVPIDEEREEE